ncbi:hypothetical protein PHMEG_00019700 [Phytophthora megakarya]|uniref:START domain-containing protein n=1 Tax=Phytophthora megakarya TaxID=4795 RepID=A0A225VR96_9STRA|nr:hypothetical protein PHMEG_00019700 [Phytophthora megakarya]
MTLGGRRGIPFAPLDLTPDQQQHCQELTFQLLDRTFRSYDDRDDSRDPLSGSPRHHANLDSTRWKQLRTQTNASLYAERTSNTTRDLHLPGTNWDNPCVLLAVGTIDSNLDEVMFGLETPDFLAMQVRSETLGKQPLDGAVLAQLAGPTDTDPFQFMGITWMVGEQNWPLNIVVRPRDFIIVSATGVVSRPNGERIGYEVVQSIDLPQCPPLPKPMVRGKLMYGAVYRQLGNGMVDVYIQMYVETQGRILDKLVIAAMWDSTLGFWNAPRLSETKKLQWCIENKSVKRQEQISALGQNRTIEAGQCENCLKKRSLLSRRHSIHLSDDSTCAMCTTPLCWRCRVKKTLKVPGEHSGKLLDMEFAVCRACMLFAQKQCPVEVAQHNQKQRQIDNQNSRSVSWRLTQESTTFSPLGSATRYPSISMSDLVKLINPDA